MKEEKVFLIKKMVKKEMASNLSELLMNTLKKKHAKRQEGFFPH